jgi:hypothetical protein
MINNRALKKYLKGLDETKCKHVDELLGTNSQMLPLWKQAC